MTEKELRSMTHEERKYYVEAWLMRRVAAGDCAALSFVNRKPPDDGPDEPTIVKARE